LVSIFERFYTPEYCNTLKAKIIGVALYIRVCVMFVLSDTSAEETRIPSEEKTV
jgi:hypothetical protein